MRPSRKALAASFVVTFAAPVALSALGACDANTAQPPAAPTTDVQPTAAPTQPAAATSAGATAPTASTVTVPMSASGAVAATGPSATTAPTSNLPPAPTVGKVTKQPDGTCMWMPDPPKRSATNGRIVPMNPPPPHAVQCPPDAGTN